jgi:ribose transport system substrate-binding protein
MKLFVRFLASAATAIALCGPPTSNGADFSSSKVVVIVKATTSEFWQTAFMGARAASKELGVPIEELGPTAETQVAEEVALVENSIIKKPAAIVVAPTNFEALAAPIEKATAAGIPVIVIDSGVKTDKYASYLTTNNIEGGKKAAIALAECIKQRTGKAAGKVAYLTAIAGNESQISRDKGFVDEIKKSYPDLQIVDNRIGNNDIAKGLSNTLDILSRFPDLVGIFADNAQMGVGAGAALDERNLGSKVALVAYDADEAEIKLLKKDVIYAVIIQDPYMMGYGGVWYGLAASKGVRTPRLVDTGVGVITKANMDEPSYKGLLQPKERKLTPFVGD